MKTTLLATLLPCIFATLQLNAQDYGSPTPVLPIGSSQIQSGTYFDPVYSVTDKSGNTYTGVVVGNSDFSVTYPSEGKGTSMQYGGMIINLDR